jgi:hypothetical protein
MRPAQFGTHCVPNWEGLVESPHIAQISLIKALPKLYGEMFCKFNHPLFAVFGPALSVLFLFSNERTDIPIHF